MLTIFLGYYEYYPKYKKIDTFFVLLGLTPSCLIILLRGNVGTDTLSYLSFFKSLIDKNSYDSSFERGFIYLSEVIVSSGANERQSIAIVSFITILLIVRCFFDNYDNIIIFTLLLFPAFFYDMTMNGLRYGLGFSLSALGVKYFYQGKFFFFVLMFIIASSIQISSLLIFFVFFWEKILQRKIIFFAISCIILAYFYLPSIINIEYFYSKNDFYKDVFSPNITSGLSPLFIFIIIYAIFLRFQEGKIIEAPNTIHLILFFEILSFAVSKFSYAGLRLQMLFLFTLILYVSNNIGALREKRKFLFSLSAVGVLSFLMTLKHFATEDDEVLSPFIPYVFFWNEIN